MTSGNCFIETDLEGDLAEAPSTEPSQIQKFYAGSTIFVTGATGFLGKLILEKLLRTCSDAKQIYILLRTKKGKDSKQRFKEIFESQLFDRLKREQPKYLNKISFVSGDCSLPNLGLDEEDKEKLTTEVDCVLHCAATVRFDEHIRTATYINVRATRDLILIAKQMKHLRAMVHISTAFSNCPKQHIEERFYPINMTSDKLLSLVESLDDKKLSAITTTLIEDWPNTYVFTKAIAEEAIRSEGAGVPISIVRPSVVISTSKEPVAGWIDNMYGPTSIIIGAAVGFLRSIYAIKENLADLVPADYVVNTILVAAWDVATNNVDRVLNGNKEEENCNKSIPIFNYVSSPENPITWDAYMKLGEKHIPQLFSPLQIWHYFFSIKSNYYWHRICVIFLHYLPAYIIDFICYCIGRKPLMVKGYKKIDKFSKAMLYFSVRQWIFTNDNVQALWKKINSQDKRLFEFSMKEMDWDTFFYTYTRGGRVYLLKDPMDTIPQGRIKYRRLQIAHYTLLTLLFLLFIKITEWITRWIFNF